jgi:hypothetical protein
MPPLSAIGPLRISAMAITCPARGPRRSRGPWLFGAPEAVLLGLLQLTEDQPAHRPFVAAHARLAFASSSSEIETHGLGLFCKEGRTAVGWR